MSQQQSLKPHHLQEKYLHSFLKQLNTLISDSLHCQTDQKHFLKESQHTLLTLVTDFLHEIFGSLFKASKKEASTMNKVLHNPALSVIAIHNLSVYLQNMKTKIPLLRIFSTKGKTYGLQEEGFDSDEDDEIEEAEEKGKEGAKVTRQMTFVFQTEDDQQDSLGDIPESQTNELQNQIIQLQKQIEELKEKVDYREKHIEQMTIGYLKDLQHLREMFIRKDLYPEEEFYEVCNYDMMKSFDPEIQKFIKEKLQEVGTKYVNTIRNQKVALKFFEQENYSFRTTINLLLGKKDVNALMQSIFVLERDPYKLWKILQDVAGGNKYFFKVFDEQKRGMGIDYKEIDELIAKSQASERLYASFKQGIEDQMNTLVETTQKEVNDLKKELQEKSDQLAFRKETSEAEIIQIKQEIKKNVESFFLLKEEQLNRSHRFELRQQLNQFVDTEAQQLMFSNMQTTALLKWKFICKWGQLKAKYEEQVKSITGLRSSLKNQQAIIQKQDAQIQQHEDNDEVQVVAIIQDDLKGWFQQINRQPLGGLEELVYDQEIIVNENNELKLETANLSSELNLLKQKLGRIQHDLMMCQQRVKYQQLTITQLENINKYFEKVYQILLQKLGYKGQEISLKNSKFLASKGQVFIDSMKKRVDMLKPEDLASVKEATQGFILSQAAQSKIIAYRNFVDADTITEIFNLKFTLTQLENGQFPGAAEPVSSNDITVTSPSEQSLELDQSNAFDGGSLIATDTQLQSSQLKSRRESRRDSRLDNNQGSRLPPKARHSLLLPQTRRFSQLNNLSTKQIIQAKQDKFEPNQLVEVEEEQDQADQQEQVEIPLQSGESGLSRKIITPPTSNNQLKRRQTRKVQQIERVIIPRCFKEIQTDLTLDPRVERSYQEIQVLFEINKRKLLSEIAGLQNHLFHLKQADMVSVQGRIHAGPQQPNRVKQDRITVLLAQQNVKRLDNLSESIKSKTSYSFYQAPASVDSGPTSRTRKYEENGQSAGEIQSPNLRLYNPHTVNLRSNIAQELTRSKSNRNKSNHPRQKRTSQHQFYISSKAKMILES